MILWHSVRCPSKNPEHFRHLSFYPDPFGEPTGKSNTKSGAEAKCLRSPMNGRQVTGLTALSFTYSSKPGPVSIRRGVPSRRGRVTNSQPLSITAGVKD